MYEDKEVRGYQLYFFENWPYIWFSMPRVRTPAIMMLFSVLSNDRSLTYHSPLGQKTCVNQINRQFHVFWLVLEVPGHVPHTPET